VPYRMSRVTQRTEGCSLSCVKRLFEQGCPQMLHSISRNGEAFEACRTADGLGAEILAN
jgi:hypothetical protein